MEFDAWPINNTVFSTKVINSLIGTAMVSTWDFWMSSKPFQRVGKGPVTFMSFCCIFSKDAWELMDTLLWPKIETTKSSSSFILHKLVGTGCSTSTSSLISFSKIYSLNNLLVYSAISCGKSHWCSSSFGIILKRLVLLTWVWFSSLSELSSLDAAESEGGDKDFLCFLDFFLDFVLAFGVMFAGSKKFAPAFTPVTFGSFVELPPTFPGTLTSGSSSGVFPGLNGSWKGPFSL